MGFYYVDLEPVEENADKSAKPIRFLYPSSIVKNIFIKGKDFSVQELRNAIESADKQCIERLTKVGGKDFAQMSMAPAREQILHELKKINEKKKYRVVKKHELLKEVEELTKGLGNAFQ